MDEARDSRVAFSWARPDIEPADRTLIGRLRRSARDVSWFDVVVALVAVAIFDFFVGLAVSGYFSVHCQDVCTLHQQAHQDRMLLLLVPTVVALPPVLLALWLGRMRVLIAAVQAVVSLALVLHAAFDLRTVNSRIHGTARCWTTQYSDKDCPWGPV